MKKSTKISLVIASIASVLISGCGTNTHYFAPQSADKIAATKHAKSITNTNIDFAKLSTKKPTTYLNQDKKQIKIQGYQDYMLLAKSGDKAVLADNKGNLVVLENPSNDPLSYDQNAIKLYEHKFFSAIILASLHNDTLALISADNTLYAIDLASAQISFTHEQGSSLGQISHLANPLFAHNLIVYPTLDAKVVFYDIGANAITQSIPVGSEQFFNNILLVQNINQALVVVSTTKILSLFGNNPKNIDLGVKNAITKDGYIYVVTDDSRLIKFDLMLQEVASVKFEFARINGMVFDGDELYLLENTGYLIHTNTDLMDIKISKIKNYKNKKSYATTKGFYFGEYFVDFSKLK